MWCIVLKVFGTRLRETREERQLTQADLARRIHTNISQILRWEKGQAIPSAEAVVRLAEELEVSSDYLLGLTDEPTGHLSESDLTPLERKFLAASDRGDLAEMFRIALEIYEEEPPEASSGAGVSRPDEASKLRGIGATKKG
jgi:transcriptional regulator with XRE-family HTH domain